MFLTRCFWKYDISWKFFNNSSSKLTLEMSKNSLFKVNLLITFLFQEEPFLNCTDDFLKTTQRVQSFKKKRLLEEKLLTN